MHVGALDPRVRVVVAQVPALDIPRSLIALIGRDGFDGLLRSLADDHAARNAGAEGTVIPVVALPGEMAFLSKPDAYDWFTSTGNTIAPRWLNQISLEVDRALRRIRPRERHPLAFAAAAADPGRQPRQPDPDRVDQSGVRLRR